MTRQPTLMMRAVALAAAATITVACASTPDSAQPSASDELSVAIASFDISVGDDRRILAGLFTPEQELLGFGTVRMQLGPLQEDGSVTAASDVTATWLPVPGMEPEGEGTAPRLLVGESGTGVYQASVDLTEPGTWGVRVIAELDNGDVLTGQTIFNVLDEPLVATPGQPAPTLDAPTLADVDAGVLPAHAVDSRAGSNGEIPYPHLHDMRLSDAIDAGRPAVVVIATPVYCVSRFCGPLTDVIAELAHDYADEAEFIHIEVWRDFNEQQLNDAAAAWIQTEIGGNEPWVFLVDSDGVVQARWDNVLDLADLTAALDAL